MKKELSTRLPRMRTSLELTAVSTSVARRDSTYFDTIRLGRASSSVTWSQLETSKLSSCS